MRVGLGRGWGEEWAWAGLELAMEVSVSKLARSIGRWWSCGCSSAGLGVWPMAAGERGM